MEVLIADGMSTDATRNIIGELAREYHQHDIQIVDNSKKIVPTGMNIALRKARGDIIVRVDGHCIIAPDYVRRCVEHIQNDRVDGVGGSIESVGETNIAQAIAVGMSSQFGVGNSAFRTLAGKSMLVDTVPFPAYKREIIERVGLYDEELVRNQDDEYNYRVRKSGGRLLLAADVHSTYFSRTSLRGLWRQYLQYGYWKVRVFQKHPLQMRLRQFIPAVLVGALIASVLMLVCESQNDDRLAYVVPVIYVGTVLSASLVILLKNHRKYLWVHAVSVFYFAYWIWIGLFSRLGEILEPLGRPDR